jgi:hypothetical protein
VSRPSPRPNGSIAPVHRPDDGRSGTLAASPSGDHASLTGPAKPQLNAYAPSLGHLQVRTLGFVIVRVPLDLHGWDFRHPHRSSAIINDERPPPTQSQRCPAPDPGRAPTMGEPQEGHCASGPPAGSPRSRAQIRLRSPWLLKNCHGFYRENLGPTDAPVGMITTR